MVKSIQKPKVEFELPDDMDQQDVDNMRQAMEQYTIEYPSDMQINMTVDTLRQYVPQRKRKAIVFVTKAMFLLNNAMQEVTFIRKTFWILSSVLFAIGYMLTLSQQMNPYIMTLILAPVPIILGIIEIFRSREDGMLEIEQSCKISAGQIMFSRMTVIGMYNIVLNTLFSFAVVPSIDSASLMKMMMCWMTPFTLVSGLSLLIAMKIRESNTASIFISCWIPISLLLLKSPEIFDLLLHINIFVWITVILSGVLVTMSQGSTMLHQYPEMERSN